MAKDYNLKIDQGADWYLDIDYKDSNEDPIDLSGHVAKMQFREETQSTDAPVLLQSLKATVTNASGSGTVVTYTATNSFAVGQNVTIRNIVPIAYNLTNATIASANSTTFTVASTATGTWVAPTTGQVTRIAYADSGIGIVPETGHLSIHATAAQTTLLTARQYQYDLKIISSDGIVTRLIQGVAAVDDQVTRV
jgi:hypothetical protein